MSEHDTDDVRVDAEEADVFVPVDDEDNAAAPVAEDPVEQPVVDADVKAPAAPAAEQIDEEDDIPLVKDENLAQDRVAKKAHDEEKKRDPLGWLKWLWVIGAVLLVGGLLLGLTQCKSEKPTVETPVVDETAVEQPVEVTTLKVGASPAPHAEILGEVIEDLAAQGVKLEIIEYSDYVVPNTALDSGEIDANFFQHVPYLDDFNAENGTDLVSVLPVHFEPLTIYAGKSASLDKIADGAQIAIPNDTTNEARALLLLEAQGLIKLKEGVGIAATPADVVDNPHNIKFVEAEAAALPRLLEDADFAVINGNFALSAGVDPALALASEDAASEAANTYANVLVVKRGNENNPAIQKLIAALKSDAIRTFIKDSYGGAVVPVF